MVKFIRGKFSRDAISEIKRKMHLDRVRYGKLPNINAKEEKQIIERTVKVFTKDGKAPYKIKERDFEKEILNPLRIKHDDLLDSKEIDEFDRGFGLTEHTKKIGVKYNSIIKQEKKLAAKKRLEEAKAKKTDENKNVSKTTGSKAVNKTPTTATRQIISYVPDSAVIYRSSKHEIPNEPIEKSDETSHEPPIPKILDEPPISDTPTEAPEDWKMAYYDEKSESSESIKPAESQNKDIDD